MSDIMSREDWPAEQLRRQRRFMEESDRIADLQNRQLLALLERRNQKILGFIPGDVADAWPWLVVIGVSFLLGAVLATVLLHVSDPATTCRSLGYGN